MKPALSRRFALAAPLTLLALAGSPPAAASTQTRAARRAVAVVDAFFEAYRTQDLARFETLIADDIEFDDPTFHLRARGKAEMMEIARALASYRNISFDRSNLIAAPPWIITQQRIRAQFTRADNSVRDIDVQGCSLFRVRDGRIAVWFDYYDILTFRAQMAPPTPAAP